MDLEHYIFHNLPFLNAISKWKQYLIEFKVNTENNLIKYLRTVSKIVIISNCK